MVGADRVMHEVSFLQNLAVVMIAAGIVTVLFQRLKQPVVLGYIAAGILIGPHLFALVSEDDTIRDLAKLGMVFLMFSLGLEFNLRKLRRVAATALVAAPLAILLMVFVGYQASGTLGQRLQQGAPEIHLHDRNNGGMVPVKVEMNMETCEGFSGHSDKRQLMRYLRTIRPRPKLVLLNHGDPQKCMQLASDIRRKARMEVRVPHNLETIRFA